MGSSPTPDLSALAERIATARASGCTLAAPSALAPLSMDDAYAVQALGLARRLAAGERLVGWKLGYTSAAMREQMGVAEPNYGPLTDTMLLSSGDAVAVDLLQPRVEPEIALRFARDLVAPVNRAQVLDAVAEALACLEVVDSVWTDYQFGIEHNTADGSSAAQVVLGPRLAAADLTAVAVTLSRNGAVVGEGRGADASGHPAEGVVWLVDQLARRGEHLAAGQVVITGGLTRAVPLEPGDTIRAAFIDTSPLVLTPSTGTATVTVHRLG